MTTITKSKPWMLLGVSSKARDIAKSAAKDAEVNLGEWVNDVIINHMTVNNSSSTLQSEEAILEAIKNVSDRMSALEKLLQRSTTPAPVKKSWWK